MKRTLGLSIVLVGAVLLGCSGHDSSGAGGDGGHGAGHSGGSGGAAGAPVGGPIAAPILDEVEPMHGALHLYWTNVTGDCDAVEGERKVADGAFTNFFSVPGTVDNEADDAATDPAVVYTYRVRCVRGDETSEYSNELSASPEPE